MPERLSLVSNMHYKLIIREENDPILAALRYEGMDEISMILVGNDNFTFKPSDNLIYGKEIFLVGAGCFFMCLIFL